MGPESGVLLHQSIQLLGVVGGPLVAALLLVGLIVGVLQAATQINDPAVGFLPRMATVLLVCWFMGPWMVERLARFFSSSITAMVGR